MVTTISCEDEFEETIVQNGVFVTFFAASCDESNKIDPILDDLEKQYDNAICFKVDVDEFSDLAARFEISSTPTTLFFMCENILERVEGADPDALWRAFEQQL